MNKAVDKYYPGLRTNTTSWSQLGGRGLGLGTPPRNGREGGWPRDQRYPPPNEIVKGLDTIKGEHPGRDGAAADLQGRPGP